MRPPLLKSAWPLALTLAALAAGCADTDLSPPPDVVFALLEPAATPPVIPLPNDLTGVAVAPITPAAAALSGPLDPATVRADDVLAIDLVAMAPLPAAPVFDPGTNRVVVMPPQGGWPAGHRIAIALRGGDLGLRGAASQPVVASPTFYFARGQETLASCTMPVTGCESATPLLPLDQAIALERLRQALAPLLAGLEALGVPRSDVVLAWTFTVTP